MAKTKVHGEFLKDSVVRFTAKAGENITKGQAVYISGISGEVPVVSLADANDTAKMPAFGLAEATVSTNAEVEITSFGTLKGLDTSSYSLGDILYVDTTAGSLTNNPSGLEATKLQNIGIVQRVHATSGSIKVGGAGRTNAVPNLDDGDIFIGDSNNKAISDSFTNVLNTEAGINSSADATAITIDSSENVGIGGSPTNYSDHKTLSLYGNTGTGAGFIEFNDTSGNADAVIFSDNGNLFINADYDNTTADSSIRFRVDGSSEKVRIDSSGAVGIGQVPETARFSGHDILQVGGRATLLGNDTVSATGQTVLLDNLYYDASGTFQHRGNSRGVAMQFVEGQVIFSNSNQTTGTPTVSERMRIDSSGRVIVSSAGSPFGADSVTIDQGGFLAIRNTSGSGMEVRRDSTDGSLIDFQKDGSSVGSIGVNGGMLTVGGGDCGLYFEAGTTNVLFPYNPSTSSTSDDDITIGWSSNRFKDLYLSGGAYLGGTGSANKLDDYEEGTWTPSITFGNGNTGQSYALRQGKYIKIGSMVYIQGHIYFSNKGTSTGNAELTGLPFTLSSVAAGCFTPIGDRGNLNTGGEPANVYLHSGGTEALLYRGGFDGGSNQVITNTAFNNATEINVNFCYYTDA